MKTLLTKYFMKGFIIAIMAMLTAGTLYSQNDLKFEFSAGHNYDESGIDMWWVFSDEDFNPAEVEVWMQEGVFYLPSKMDNAEKIATLTSSDWEQERNFYLAHLDKEFEKGYFTFYLSVTDEAGNKLNSNVSTVSFYEWGEDRYVSFTSTPNTIAFKNEIYEYTAQAVYEEDADAEIEYSIIEGPEGMTIDSETGLVNWTPEESGLYRVWFHATVKDNHDVFGEQYYMLRVFECEEPAQVTVVVRDKEGNLVQDGYIQLVSENYETDHQPEMLADGKAFLSADKGNYYLFYQDKYGYYEMYEGAYDITEATVLNLDCGDNLSIEWELSNGMTHEEFTVTGTVYYADGIPVPNQLINFEGTWANGGEERLVMYSTTTNDDGRYEIELSSDFTFIAYIDLYWNPVTGVVNTLYFDQTYDRAQAEKFVLTENRYDINFVIDSSYSMEYHSISGNVSLEDGSPVEGAVVMFEGMMQTGKGRMPYLWEETKTDENGNYNIELPEFFEYRVSTSTMDNNLFRPLYYDQTYDGDEATLINLSEDIKDINFVLTDPDFDFYTITGNVSTEDGNPIEGAMVIFEGFTDDPNYRYNRWSGSVSTDEEGNYEIELPEIFDYIAYCFNVIDDNRFGCMVPMYYHQTYNPDEASIISLDTDIDGINFVFGERDDENKTSISGTVVNENGDLLNDVFVVGYKVGNDNDDFFFDGRASISNSDGAYKLVSLVPGEYVILAMAKDNSYLPGFYRENDFATMKWGEATIIEVAEGDEITNIEIKLDSYGEEDDEGGICQATGKITAIRNLNTHAKDNVSGAIVYIENEQGKVAKYSTSNSDGSFNLKNLPYGKLDLVVEKVGYKNYETEIEFTDNSQINVGEILLQPEVMSVEENTVNQNNISVFPNPATDNIRVSYRANTQNSTIKIINSKSEEMFVNEYTNTIGSNNQVVNTSELTNGAYFVIVKTGSSSQIYPIIIQR